MWKEKEKINKKEKKAAREHSTSPPASVTEAHVPSPTARWVVENVTATPTVFGLCEKKKSTFLQQS